MLFLLSPLYQLKRLNKSLKIMILLSKIYLTNPITPKLKFLKQMDTPSGREGLIPLKNKKKIPNNRKRSLNKLETLTFVRYARESLILSKLWVDTPLRLIRERAKIIIKDLK